MAYLGYQKQELSALPKEKNPLEWDPRPVSDFVLDIERYRKALRVAQSLNPTFYLLMDVYEKTLVDTFLSSQIENRFTQTLSAKFNLKKSDGTVDEKATEALEYSPIHKFLVQQKLDSILWGNSLVKIDYDTLGNIAGVLMPRTNINPIEGLFFKDYTQQNGISYRDMPEFGTWYLEYRNTQEPLGLLKKCVPQVVIKRFAQIYWSEHAEIFSTPPRVVKTNTRDTKMMARAKKMMEDYGRSAYFIIDNAENFEFANQIQTKGEIYQELMKACQNELSLILSGAVVGQDTKVGSNAKEVASQDLLWYRVQSDMKMVEQMYNQITLPALVKHGIVPDGLHFEFEPAEDIAQLWTFTSQAMPYYDFDPAWLKDKFGIEVIQKSNNTGTGLSAKPFFLEAPTKIGAMTHSNCCGQVPTFNLSGSLDDDKLIKSFWDAQGEKGFDYNIFQFTVQNLTEAFSQGWTKAKEAKLSALGIDYGFDDPNALTAYEMNLFRFGGIKTLAESQLLNKAFRESTSFEDFRVRASLITKIHNVEWLRTEYNTALSVGETSATYQRLKSKTDLFPYWEYRTVDDNRVRPEHRLLDGLILPANHALWQKIYPPNGWNCRCYVVPRLASEIEGQDIAANINAFEEFIGSDEFQKATKSGWGINRAEQEQVFTANQQYISRVTEANKLLSNLGPDDYKIKEVTNKPARELYSGTAEEFLRENGLDYSDYNKRKIKGIAEVLTSAEPELLQELQNVLNKPDEVWYQAEAKNQTFNRYLYIKYYEDTPVALIAEYQKGEGLQIVQFFKLLDLLLRWGLLIK